MVPNPPRQAGLEDAGNVQRSTIGGVCNSVRHWPTREELGIGSGWKKGRVDHVSNVGRLNKLQAE